MENNYLDNDILGKYFDGYVMYMYAEFIKQIKIIQPKYTLRYIDYSLRKTFRAGTMCRNVRVIGEKIDKNTARIFMVWSKTIDDIGYNRDFSRLIKYDSDVFINFNIMNLNNIFKSCLSQGINEKELEVIAKQIINTIKFWYKRKEK